MHFALVLPLGVRTPRSRQHALGECLDPRVKGLGGDARGGRVEGVEHHLQCSTGAGNETE